MKFGQLVERNMWNNFLQKSYTKCDGKTSLRPFSEKLKLSIAMEQYCKVLYSFFLFYVQVDGYGNMLKLSCRPLVFTSY